MKLNLGCGSDYRKGYINTDINTEKRIDMIIDINKIPYNFQNNTFDEVLLLNVLEYAIEPFKIMEEIYRISKDEATIFINVPYKKSIIGRVAAL